MDPAKRLKIHVLARGRGGRIGGKVFSLSLFLCRPRKLFQSRKELYVTGRGKYSDSEIRTGKSNKFELAGRLKVRKLQRKISWSRLLGRKRQEVFLNVHAVHVHTVRHSRFTQKMYPMSRLWRSFQERKGQNDWSRMLSRLTLLIFQASPLFLYPRSLFTNFWLILPSVSLNCVYGLPLYYVCNELSHTHTHVLYVHILYNRWTTGGFPEEFQLWDWQRLCHSR